MSGLDIALLDALTAPAPRLPEIERWLLDEVWGDAAFEACARSPAHRYTLTGCGPSVGTIVAVQKHFISIT